jgi:hypothetical protein
MSERTLRFWRMHMNRRFQAVASTAVLGLAVGVGAATAETSDTDHPLAQKITRHGVGEVELGNTHKSLRRRDLVGKLRHGCNLGGPNTRSARLKAPLEGSVDYTLHNPRRVTNITITEGGAAKGVGIGDSIRDIKHTFPHARVDHSTDRTFGLTLVSVPREHGNTPRFTFAVSTGHHHHVKLIGIPFIAFCE